MINPIHTAHLWRDFGTHTAVADLSLDIAIGEIYGLVGPDGAGKTTTMRLLCGALRPSHRKQVHMEITIAGRDLLLNTDQAREQLGYLPQRFSLYEDLTVLENLRFFAEVRGLSRSTWLPRCMEILEFVGLSPFVHRWAGQLSGGMKQKLGLAAALVHQPQVLLLDEPTTGVDPVTRQDFWQLIIRLAASDKISVLVSTPYMDEAARCHRIGFLRDGQLLVEGSPESLRRKLEERIIEVRGSDLPALRHLIARQAHVENVQLFGDRLHLRTRAGMAQTLIDSLMGTDARIRSMRRIPAQLEDVFIALLEENA
jgi:ABC-2 type transport system ATP-binding protein